MSFVWTHLEQAWRKRFFSNFFVFFVLLASFLVLNSGIVLFENFQVITENWGSKIEMNVYLKEGNDFSALEQRIRENPMVATVAFVSKNQAMTDLRNQLGTQAAALLKDQDLAQFIPASLLVEVKPGGRTGDPATDSSGDGATDIMDRVRSLASDLKNHDQVEDVQYGQGILQQFRSVLNVFRRVGFALFGVLLGGALFMVVFVIRNSMNERREEIELLELVGASRSMIRVPFIVEGLLFAAAAAAMSLLIGSFLFENLRQTMASEDIFIFVASRLRYLSFSEGVALVFAAAGIGAVASLISIRQMNTGFAAAERAGTL
ncbi:MAG: hypothetical protein C5B49_00860 [Bdellovibrio sp.]|nr:MAG: hypothetical protein C5B49_00860 [Bdellovibrio sp.]